jgi:hypothetical protein
LVPTNGQGFFTTEEVSGPLDVQDACRPLVHTKPRDKTLSLICKRIASCTSTTRIFNIDIRLVTVFESLPTLSFNAMAAMDQIPPEQLAKLAGEDLGPLTKNIVIAFTVIALVSVSLRIYTRFRYKAIGWEDYSIIIATVCQSHILHAMVVC